MIDATASLDSSIDLNLCVDESTISGYKAIIWNPDDEEYNTQQYSSIENLLSEVKSEFERNFSEQIDYYGINFVTVSSNEYTDDDYYEWPTPPDKMISYAG